MEIHDIHTHYTPCYFNSKEEWETYATYLRKQLLVGVGLAPYPEKTALNEDVFGLVEFENEGYSIEKVSFEALPGYFVTGNLYRPLNADKPAPAVLSPHGHWPQGRLHEHGRLVSVPARCIELAKMGIIAFSYDMMGYGDSCQVDHRNVEMNLPYGFSPMGIQTWSSIRALDFLETLPYVDMSRVGVTGASGGGTQTFLLAALDERISAAAPVCMISYHMQGGCKCENAPLIRVNGTSVDIARLFAPKPLFMGSCSGDWTKHTKEEELPAVTHIYELYQNSEVLHHHHVDEDHNYNQEMCGEMYKFFNKYLLNSQGDVPVFEKFMEYAQRPVLRDQMVWWGRETPKQLSQEAFFAIWNRENKVALAKASDEELVEYLPFTIAMNDDTLATYGKNKPSTLTVKEENDSLIIDSKTPEYEKELKESYLTVCYNHTIFAIRVHEIISYLQNCPSIKSVTANGTSGVAMMMALSIIKLDLENVTIDMNGCDITKEESVAQHFDTPAICQVGGGSTILKGIKMHNPNCKIQYK